MSMYYCHKCDQFVDDDYSPMEVIDGEEMCPECAMEVGSEREERESDDESTI